MSVSERVEKIIAERNGATQATQVIRDNEAMSELDRSILSRCVNAIHTFDVTESLNEIHQEVLTGRGEVSEDSYLEVGKDRVAVAEAILSWQDENAVETIQIGVNIRKMVGSSRPFELTIESSEGMGFSASFDTPETDQLTRDGDIGRWDIRDASDLDDDLGFFSSPDDLKRGIEERLAKASAKLITHK